MRGTFTPEAIAARDTEWCERRRLARIHRYPRDRKRAEFQPVPAAAFMRFLFDWPGLVGCDKREGQAALELVFAEPEGFPVGDSAWESRSEEHTSELQTLMRNSYAGV